MFSRLKQKLREESSPDLLTTASSSLLHSPRSLNGELSSARSIDGLTRDSSDDANNSIKSETCSNSDVRSAKFDLNLAEAALTEAIVIASKPAPISKPAAVVTDSSTQEKTSNEKTPNDSSIKAQLKQLNQSLQDQIDILNVYLY